MIFGTAPDSSTSVLSARSLAKRFGTRTVVNDVSIEVRAGEVVGLLGPNGAGKTTTFGMVVGLVEPDAGEVLLDGNALTDLPMFRRARMGVGYLPQENSIFRKMTALENLLAIVDTLPMHRPERLDRARTLDGEVKSLRRQMEDLLKSLNPRNPGPAIPPVPVPSGPKPSAGAGDLDRLQRDLDRTSAQAHLVRVSLDPIIDRWNHTPSIPPTAGYLSSPFGIRLSPFARRNEADDGLLGFHQGVDITNSEGTPIQASADGEVQEAGPMGRYGNGVVLSHGPQLETLYAHMSRVAVKEGHLE